MKYLFSILFLKLSLSLNAQIIYTKIPIDLQLVARDKLTNLGNVSIEGVVDIASGFESLRVETYRNDVFLNNNDKTLEYVDSKARFTYTITIPSELANYTFRIYGFKVSGAIYELDKTISNIVAGDAIIIQGQSNAAAPKFNGSANSNKSEFIRVYANGTPYGNSLASNDAWYIADGDGGSSFNGNAGQWGLKLARLLSDNLNIPIAVFNGAHGGKSIDFFKAPKNYTTSLDSNYGRLYYRLNKTALKNSVRAVLWSQGEANAGSAFTSITSYVENFISIRNSWLIDFPSVEKIYLFQTKDCIASTPDGEMRIKEAQRLLAVTNEKIDIISTTSLTLLTDSCHFPYIDGYEEFAKRVYKLVLKDIYNFSFSDEIKSPMIKSVEFTEPNILVLETDARELKFSSTDQITMLTRLKQDFELRNAQNATIKSVNLLNNKIIFTLSSDPGPIANISFVGYYSNIGYTITNLSDLELISFRNFPIKNLSINNGDNSSYPTIEDASICNITSSLSTISVLYPDPIASYTWLLKTPVGEWTEIKSSNASSVYLNYNSPILEIIKSSTLPVLGTIYRVVADKGLLGKFTSNEATLTFDAAPVSKLISGASTICAEQSKTLNYGIGSVGTIQWQYSTTSAQEDFIDLYDENALSFLVNNLEQTTWFRVMNYNGVCTNEYSPAVQIKVDPKTVSGTISGGNISVCRTNNSTVLTLNNYTGKIQWQRATTLNGVFSNITTNATLDKYTASGLTATTYFRAIVSSGICTPQITEPVVIIVESTAISKTITGASPICVGDSKTLSYGLGSLGTTQWQYSTQSSTTGFFDIIDENSLTYTTTNLQQATWFRVKNYIGSCSSVFSPAVQVLVNPKPIAGNIIGGNKSVCKTANSTTLNLNNSSGTIQWQKSTTESGVYSNITSVTSTSFTASGLTNTTYYRAVLSGNFCASQITEPTVIVVDDVSVAKTILGASPTCAGDSKTLNYETGSVGSIQWEYSNISNSSGFLEIDNPLGLTYTATNLQQSTWYRVKNTNGTCPSVTSPAVQITVVQKPVAGYVTGGNTSVCKTSNSTVLKLLNYVGEIQWQKASSFSGTYSNISAATSNSYTATNLTLTTFYRAKLSNGICTPVFTEPVAINISVNAESKTISGALPICSGENITLSYELGSIGTIQWQLSTTSGSSGFTDLVGQNDLNYSANNLQRTTWFKVKNSIGTCSTVLSAAVQVTVTTKPVAGFISGGNINLCKTTSSRTLTLNNYVGNIQWQKSGTFTGDYSNISLANSATYSVSGLTSSGYFRAVLSNGICTQEITEPVSIRIDDLAVTKTISGAAPICVGDSKTLNYGEGSVGTIQWQYSTISNTTGFEDINGENDLNYKVTNLQTNTWFRVKNTSGVCPINHSPAVQITVYSTPAPSGNTTQYFNFSNPVFISNLVVKGTDIKWYSTHSDALTNNNRLQPSTSIGLENTYYALQTLNGCNSSNTLAVTVNSNLEIEGFNFDMLEFYPNPFTNYFKLKYPEIITSIELFNTLGQSVLKTNPNDKETTLSVNHLSSGIYFMEISSKKNKGIIKGIKL